MYERSGNWILLLVLSLACSHCIGIPRLEANAEYRRFLVMMDILPRSHAGGVEIARGLLGPAGGRLVSSDRLMSLEVPPKSLTREREFRIRRYPVQVRELPEPYRPALEAYEIRPRVRFQRPVRVRLRQPGRTRETTALAAVAVARREPVYLSGWQNLEAEREGDWVVLDGGPYSFFTLGRHAPRIDRPPTISQAALRFELRGPVLRARIRDPEGGAVRALVETGAGLPRAMVPEGGDWYRAELPASGTEPGRVGIRIVAEDEAGSRRLLPPRPFRYPIQPAARDWRDLWTGPFQ